MNQYTETDRALFSAAVAVLRMGSAELRSACVVLESLADGDEAEAISTLARRLRLEHGDAGRQCRRAIGDALAALSDATRAKASK